MALLSRPFRSALTVLALVACGSPPPPVASADPEPSIRAARAQSVRAPDDARGGRLFDHWLAEKELSASLTVDSAKTAELDGRGGPNGNGTLGDGMGKPLPNTGHDYRLKNLFGWDLRGKAGVYGPEYQNKPYVLEVDLLADQRSPEALRAWFENGGQGLPAYGAVLTGRDLDELVAFVVKTRSGELARPDAIFRLEKSAPKGYVLNPGGDAKRGRETYDSACSKCHGADGTKLAIDEVESTGSLARSAAYEVWFKIAHGHPGSPMLRQVNAPDGAAQARAILDLLAALCDTKAFPPLAREGAKDVPAGDPRCGAYLR